MAEPLMASPAPQRATPNHGLPAGASLLARARSLPAYERVDGLHLLRLHGTDREMGYQHGQLLRHVIDRGPLPYFSRYVNSVLRHGILGRASLLAAPLLYATVGRRIGRAFPERVRQALDGLAEGAGLSRHQLMRAVTMPETFLAVMSAFNRFTAPATAPRLGVPVMGCTSAAAWGSATVDGELLHARNFDYQGVGAWDREAAVIFHLPEGGQPYVSIASAGVLLGGITGMNHSGLTLAVHQHMFCMDFDLGGLPVGVAGDEVMRHAHNLDDARRILDGHTPNGCWTYVIASGPERAVLVYEVTPKRRAWWVVGPQQMLAYTNMYMHPDLADSEVHGYPAQWRWVAQRYHGVTRMLEAGRGALDADAMAGMLGDTGDAHCRFRSAISCLSTVASVVFRPQDGVVYVAKGPAPTANTPFVPFSLPNLGLAPDHLPLEAGVRAAGARGPAFEHYRQAFDAFFNGEDLTAAREHLAQACSLQPHEPLYLYMDALCALQAGEPQAALTRLDAALAVGHPDRERLGSFRLWRGRALDMLGQREQARQDYALAADWGDAAVKRAAARSNRHRYHKADLALDFTFAEVVMP